MWTCSGKNLDMCVLKDNFLFGCQSEGGPLLGRLAKSEARCKGVCGVCTLNEVHTNMDSNV